jgi:hypothetical integral membrane protein (TIGR02206 family)
VSASFQPFSLTHALVLLGIALVTIVLCVIGRRTASAETRGRLEQTLALANLFVWVMAHVYWLLPAQFEARTSLPLQLCHLAALAASASLLSGRRIFRTLVYYWGFGLSTQALLTPALEDGPAILWFWVFWQQHAIVVAVACYDLVVRGYRPTWADYRQACLATFAYFCVAFPIDVAFGLNYGFVGPSRPDYPTIIDLLGPWPGRLVLIFAIIAAVMALITWPWTRQRANRAREPLRAARRSDGARRRAG